MKFEYKSFKLGNSPSGEPPNGHILNQFGKDGWEFVCAISAACYPNGTTTFYLKRQKSDETDYLAEKTDP